MELLQSKVQRGDTLTLDERVYWFEAKAMGASYSLVEPAITTADQTISFLARHGVHKTREQLTQWLTDNGVPL